MKVNRIHLEDFVQGSQRILFKEVMVDNQGDGFFRLRFENFDAEV